MIYDIVIIGSGISGLNLCDKLNKKEKILLLEKDNNIGGRIQTIKKNGLMYEAGAARFNNYHNKLINLIKTLKLENKFIKIDNKTEYKSYPKNLNNNLKKEFNNIDKIIELLIKKTKDLSKEELQKHTIKSLLKKYLEKDYKKNLIQE
jgi:protoporphyrinogen oxidase